QAFLKSLEVQLDLRQEPAIGLIWYSVGDGMLTIDPIIFVRATNSIVYESACGTGSLALAYAWASDVDKQSSQISIAQPSGFTIDCLFVRDPVNATIKASYISGIVELRGEFSVPLVYEREGHLVPSRLRSKDA